MDLREAIASQTDVALTLTSRLIATEATNKNLVYSPVSIHVVLSLIAAGSKGRTLDELLSFLKSKSPDDLGTFVSQLVDVLLADGAGSGGPKLAVANGVWVDGSLKLKARFEQVVSGVYKAAPKQVDFQTKHVEVTSEVNSWADEKTGGLIKEILPSGSVDHTTRLILTNAIYFKGSWTEKFDASATKDHDFHLLAGSSVRAPFMTSKKKQLVAEFEGFKVLGLPYKQGEDKRQFSMYIFLPDAKDGLPALTEKLGSGSGFLDEHIPRSKVAVGQFLIPKFKISFGFEASKVLEGLGLVSPFTGPEGLTEMVESPSGQDLYVSSIFHKSFIEVNEEGTEAAAATAGVINLRSLPITTDFVADHPFLFVIRENMTGVVLFIGHILNPLEN
uniref:Serpin domain-containing protein n=1 Tax=Kalanchoe fedtschenkoi TaxID=63787 RepID=A0A7N0ZQ88_KALFE